MSLYHLNRTVIKRSTGQSVCGALSYIHRTKIQDEFIGKTYHFNTKVGEIVESKIYIPEGASWEVKKVFEECALGAGGVATFAKLIEKAENDIVDKRCKSEDARESYKNRMQTGFMEVVALQKELSLDQNRKIVDQYIEKVYMPRGLMVSSAIHFDEGNPHAHLFISLRSVGRDGFSSVKERELMTRTGLKACREAWAEVNNEYFKVLGLENRITDKSFKDLGVQLLPTIHEGDARYTKFSEVVVETNKTRNEQLRLKNQELLKNEPERMLPLLMSKRVTFTEADITREFQRIFSDKSSLSQSLTASLLKADEVIKINQTRSGKTIYTTQTYLKSEEALLDSARKLSLSKCHGLKEAVMSKVISKSFDYLSLEQKKAVKSVTQGEALSLVVGKAGSGKSTLMKAVAQCYQAKGYRVFGGAWSGAAAEGLAQTIGVPSHTLLSWLKKWESFEDKAYNPHSAGGFFRSGFFLEGYKQQLNHRSLFILDEAGTVDVEHMSKLLARAHAVGAKVIAVGDSSQTSPIGPGEAFRALCEGYPHSKLEGIKRQKELWMREASSSLSQHDITKGLKAYDENQCIHWHDNRSVHQALVKDYLSSYKVESSQIALAQRNEDVFQLNLSVHTQLKGAGQLGRKSLLVKTQTSFGAPTVEFTVWDRILFLQNDHQGRFVKTRKGKGEGVTNGTIGIITTLKSDEIRVRLEDKRIVSLNPKAYPYISHGYAMTVSKAQGKTVDKSYVLINNSMEAADTYVALTRHREDCQIYVNQSQFKDLKTLLPHISKARSFDFINLPIEKVNKKSIEKSSFYDRKDILNRIKITDIPGLVERYTPFLQNPKASRGETVVFSESGQGTSVQITLKPDGPVCHNFKDGFGADLIGFLGHYSNKSYGEMCKELGQKFGVGEVKELSQRQETHAPIKASRDQVKAEIIKRQKAKKEDIQKSSEESQVLKACKSYSC